MREEQTQYYLNQANTAYRIFTDNGPLFGRKQGSPDTLGSPPTWRIAAEPQWLPERYRYELEQLGQDIYRLGNVLGRLPATDKATLGNYVSFDMPPTFRLDTILTRDGLKVNEIQVADGADALMIIEQLAYGLQSLDQSTAAKMIEMLKEKYPTDKKIRIAILRGSRDSNYTPNAAKMTELIGRASRGKVEVDIMYPDELSPEGLINYQGIINYAYLSPEQLVARGLRKEQLLAAGDFAAIGNKGIFALLFDETKKEFWINNLGEETYERLLKYFIPSEFVSSLEAILSAKERGDTVIKAYAVNNTDDIRLLDSGQSVFGPWDKDAWEKIPQLVQQGIRFIAQKMEIPLRLKTLLRANKGKALERQLRYNRICVKYVTISGQPQLSAVEATLGQNIKPTGRDTSFIPVQFTRRRSEIRPFDEGGY